MPGYETGACDSQGLLSGMLVGLDLQPSGCLVLTESLPPWIESTALVTLPEMSYSIPFDFNCPSGSVLSTFIQTNDTFQLECSKFAAADRTDSCTSISFTDSVLCENKTLAGISLSESYNGTNGTAVCCRLLGSAHLIAVTPPRVLDYDRYLLPSSPTLSLRGTFIYNWTGVWVSSVLTL